MPNKLIKDMDEETWKRFVAFCKLNDSKVNNELKNILDKFLDKNLSKAINKRYKK